MHSKKIFLFHPVFCSRFVRLYKTRCQILKREHIHYVGKLTIMGLLQKCMGFIMDFVYTFSRAVKLVWFVNH